MLWAASIVVVGFAFFPELLSLSASVAEKQTHPTASDTKTIVLNINGMTCAGCAVGLQSQLASADGVASAHVNYDTSSATITPKKNATLTVANLTKIVKTAGYSGTLVSSTSAKTGISNKMSILPAGTEFYAVNLVCPAAKEIGCGGRASTVIAVLKKNFSSPEKIWLNKSGTQIAIRWKDDTLPKNKSEIFNWLKTNCNVIAKSVGNKLDSSTQSWYDQESLKDLSAIEAEVITNRLVLRLLKQISLSTDVEKRLRTDLEPIILKRLLVKGLNRETTRQQIMAKLDYLGEKEKQALIVALNKGYRAIAGELDSAEKCGLCKSQI